MVKRLTSTPEDGAVEPSSMVDEASDRAGGSRIWSNARILPADAVRAGSEDPEERLRCSSKAFLAVLAALEVMQGQKVGLPASDARRMGLARYIDELAVELVLRNQHETRLLTEAAGPPSCEPPPGFVVLTDWQLAERSLRAAVRELRRVALTSAGFEEASERAGTEHAD